MKCYLKSQKLVVKAFMKEQKGLYYYPVISFIIPDKKKTFPSLGLAGFLYNSSNVYTAMLLSNYQLLTLYNNLLDIFAPIYINLVNFVGALSKCKFISYHIFISLATISRVFISSNLLTMNIKGWLLFNVLYIYIEHELIYLYIYEISLLSDLYTF